jgi:phage terminase large subunit
VQKRLRIAHDGRPRLFFLRDSLVERDSRLSEAKLPTCTEEEITGYVWPQGRDGRPQKEVPVKEFDHGLDAMRYASMYVDQPAPFSAIEIGESPFGWE